MIALICGKLPAQRMEEIRRIRAGKHAGVRRFPKDVNCSWTGREMPSNMLRIGISLEDSLWTP